VTTGRDHDSGPEFRMDFYVKDFFASTVFWTAEDRAYYLLLLAAGWLNGAKLPTDPEAVRVSLGVTPEAWARVWPTLESKFPMRDHQRANGRQAREWGVALARFAGYSEASRRANRVRWGPKPDSGSDPVPLRTGVRSVSSTTTTTTTEERVPSSPTVPQPENVDPLPRSARPRRSSGADGFEEFWSSYPRRAGKGKALEAWKKKVTEAERPAVLAAVRQFAASWGSAPSDRLRFIVHPSVWLNQGRWNDDPREAALVANDGNPEIVGSNPNPGHTMPPELVEKLRKRELFTDEEKKKWGVE
jgi:uncharacterized protein YdaU (DUF1376 family)